MNRINTFKYTLYILLFFAKQLKDLLIFFKRIFLVELKYYNPIKLFFFSFNKNINPAYSKDFNNYTKNNYKIWKNNSHSKKNILVTSFVHAHPAYPHGNCIIGKYLQEYYNANLIGFCDSHDKTSEIIIRSFKIKEFVYLKQKNLITQLIYFIYALNIISNFKNIYDLLNFKFNNIDLGKIVYDDVLRRSGQPTINDITFKLCLHFSKALNLSDQYKKILNKRKIEAVVQSETQFSPSGIIFQQSLVNKIPVFAREGSGKIMSIKKFSSFSERYTARDQPSKKIFKLVFKNKRKKASKLGIKGMKSRLSGTMVEEDLVDSKWAHHNKKKYSKMQLCKKFQWSSHKPILVIFSHSLIDGNYCQGSRIFKDNLTWLRETLKHIKKIKKYNWIIKPHPMDWYYKFAKTTTELEYKQILGNEKHVKICPKDLSSISISKIVTAVVTSHGSAGIEYACLGLPVIMAGRTSFSDLNVNFRAKTKKQYFNLIDKAHKLIKPNKLQVDKAGVSSFIYSVLNKAKNQLIPYFLYTRYVNKNKFYRDTTKLIKKYNHKEDYFKMLSFFQFKNNLSQTLNLKVLETKLNYKLKRNDLK